MGCVSWAVIGLGVMFLLGGGWMMREGYWAVGRRVDCNGMEAEECAVEQESWDSWAERQMDVGIGMMGVGALPPLALWLRQRRRAAGEQALKEQPAKEQKG
jgi:hypothetical protein